MDSGFDSKKMVALTALVFCVIGSVPLNSFAIDFDDDGSVTFPTGTADPSSMGSSVSSITGENPKYVHLTQSGLAEFSTNYDILSKDVIKTPYISPTIIARFREMDRLAATYNSKYGSCDKDASLATWFCMEDSNPAVKNSTMMITLLLGAARTVVNAKHSCSLLSKAMDWGQKGFLLYQGSCSAVKLNCDLSCGSAAQAMEGVKNQLNAMQADLRADIENAQKKAEAAARANPRFCGAPTTAGESQCEAYVKQSTAPHAQLLTNLNIYYANLKKSWDTHLVADNAGALANKSKMCSGYGASLAQAGLGILMTVTTASQANGCKKQLSNAQADCTKEENKFHPSCIQSVGKLNCSDPAYANNQTCICNANPNSAGCPGAVTVSSLTNDPSNGGSYSPATRGVANATVSSAGTTTPAATSAAIASKTSASTDVGGSKGGSAAGSSGFSASSLTGSNLVQDQAVKGDSKVGYDTSVLGSDYGSGGAGYSGGFNSANDNSTYGSHLPGGKNDPAARIAGAAAAWTKEVSSPGGKSNWEKVQDRYRDNGVTLLGQ